MLDKWWIITIEHLYANCLPITKFGKVNLYIQTFLAFAQDLSQNETDKTKQNKWYKSVLYYPSGMVDDEL